MPEPTRRTLFGLPLDPMTMDSAVAYCVDAVTHHRGRVLGVVNAAKVVALQSDTELRQALLDCDRVLADGQSVVWASRILGQPVPERVAGIDLFERLLREADRRSWSVYFLGAKEAVLASMLERVRAEYPGLHVAGARNGYFPEDESARVAGEIAATEADLLFVGMTSPRKEVFLRQWGASCARGACHGVGGSFDVLSGITRRAPVVWQRLGLEWLYRLLQEPRRMWRRYLTSNSAFLVLLLRELMKRPGRAGVAAVQPGPTVPTAMPTATSIPLPLPRSGSAVDEPATVYVRNGE